AYLMAARIAHMRLFQAVEIADAAAAQAFKSWLIEEVFFRLAALSMEPHRAPPSATGCLCFRAG
ncbi:hypothetical protein, partial [Brevundimonas sp.]